MMTPRHTAQRVADLLQQVSDAGAMLAREVDRIAHAPRPDWRTIRQLRELAELLEPAACAREQLRHLDSSTLLGGAELYLRRRGVAEQPRRSA